MVQVFTVDIFIICFRESLEASVIVSVLLAFVKQSFGRDQDSKVAYKRLLWQIWLGTIVGVFICLVIGGGFIGVYYTKGKDYWGKSEDLWEGIFSLIACVMITAMGLPMLRINKMQSKWRLKIAKAILEVDDDETEKAKKPWYKRFNIKNYNPLQFRFAYLSKWCRKYAMFILPLITCLREGLEMIVFVGGVTMGHPANAFPLSVVLGLICGIGFGYVIYKVGDLLSIRYFLIFSTCLLYLIASGLFSRGVRYLEMDRFNKQTGGDVGESGSGPGSYNIKTTVWHVNCCNPEMHNNGWGIFNALFGWQNTASYGSVISYNCYWIFMMAVIGCLIYEEKTGKLPVVGRWYQRKRIAHSEEEELYQRAQERVRKMQADANTENGSNEKEASSLEYEANQAKKQEPVV